MSWKQLVVLSWSLAACGIEPGKGGRPDWEGEVDPVEDIGDPPEEASSGDIWECVFYGYGDNGATMVEFEDRAEFCFAEREDADDYVIQWRDDCVEALTDDGFFNYLCEAVCEKTDEEC